MSVEALNSWKKVVTKDDDIYQNKVHTLNNPTKTNHSKITKIFFKNFWEKKEVLTSILGILI